MSDNMSAFVGKSSSGRQLRQFPNQRVLAFAGTDDEEFHKKTFAQI